MKTDHTGNEVQIYLNEPYYREGCRLWGYLLLSDTGDPHQENCMVATWLT